MTTSSHSEMPAPACSTDDVDPAWWFSFDPAEAQQALDTCSTRPVQDWCREEARTAARAISRTVGHGLDGIWAGRVYRSGIALDRLPRRGRPRRTEATA